MKGCQIQAVSPKSPSPSTPSLLISKIPPFDEMFLKDAAGFEGMPDEVATCHSESQVAALLEGANRSGKPLFVLGGGTGLTGGSVAHGGTLLDTRPFNRLLQLQKSPDGSGRAVVEPGMKLGDFLNLVRKENLFYLPGPTHPDAFFGGMVNTNAAGAPSFRYGRTGAWVRRLRVALPIPNRDGKISVLEVERGKVFSNESGTFEILLLGGEKVILPAREYPFPTVKHTGGYRSGKGLDLIDLFIGSEGTLGIVTEIELKLLPLEGKETLLSGFVFLKTFESLLQLVDQCKKKEMALRRCEVFDEGALHLLRRSFPEIPQESQGALFFEEEVPPSQEEARYAAWEAEFQQYACLDHGVWMAGSQEKEAQSRFQSMRLSLPVQVNALMAERHFRKIGTDFVLPEEKLSSFFKILLSSLKAASFPSLFWMHALDNHFHINFLPEDEKAHQEASRLKGRLAQAVLKAGGSLSGEHGFGESTLEMDGNVYPFIELHFEKEAIRQMAKTKKALDPNCILNPGKVIPQKWLEEDVD